MSSIRCYTIGILIFFASIPARGQSVSGFASFSASLDSIQGSDASAVEEILHKIDLGKGRYPALCNDQAFRALTLSKALGEDSLIIQSMIMVGQTYKKMAAFDTALTYYLNAIEYAKRVEDHSNISQGYVSLYYLYKHRGLRDRLDEVIAALRKEAAFDLGNKAKGSLFFTLNNYHSFFGDPDSAMYMLDSAEKYWSRIDEPDALGLIMNNRAIQFINRGDTQRGIENFKSIVEHPRIQDSKPEAFKNLFVIYSWKDDYETALEFAHAGRLWAESYTNQNELVEAYSNEAEALEMLGRKQEALDLLWKRDELKDSLSADALLNAIAEAQTKYDLQKREAEIRIARVERNLFIFIAIGIGVILIIATWFFFYRTAKNRQVSEARIRQLEKEKEVTALQTMLFAQEEERQRIARDLHDSIGALLSAAKLQLSNVASEGVVKQEMEALRSTEDALTQANAEVRRVAHDMMPGVLMKLGLMEGIEDFFDRVRASSNINVEFTYDELDDRLDNKREVMMYRIVQELVNNTIKHAEATQITLDIRKREGQLVMRYTDNGKGFNADFVDDPKHFGMAGLKSRVNFLEGEMEILSEPGKGSTFIITIT